MRMKKLPEAGQTIVENESYSYVPGGKGANAALALSRLGADSVFCARLGCDVNGKKLKELYDANGIDTRFIKFDRMNPTGLASIIVEESGANRIIVYPGANEQLSEEDVEDAMTCLPDALFLQLEIPFESVLAASGFAAKRSIPIILDAGPASTETPLEALPPLEIISPNESETLALTGIYPNDSANSLRAANALLSRVQAKYVVIKLGGRGAYIHDGKFSQLLPAYDIEAVDTTAAGDAFTAALTLEYLNSGDIVRAVRYANAVGAIVVGKAGASSSLPTAAQVEEFLQQRGIRL